MQRYHEYAPTPFDRQNLTLRDPDTRDTLDRSDWFVVGGQNRDSSVLAQSNFATMLKILGGESATVEVHRMGHWGCGWLEVILIDPMDGTAVLEAESLLNALEDYPVADTEDYYNRCWEATCEAWEAMSIRDRVSAIREYGTECEVSVFSARRDELPQGLPHEEHIWTDGG